MKNISVSKINISNLMLRYYMKTINFWDERGLEIPEDHFYATLLDDKFLAASTMKFDPETSAVSIRIVNGSRAHYDEIQNETVKRLMNIAQEMYDVKDFNLEDNKELAKRR